MNFKIILAVLSVIILVFVASMALIAFENNATDTSQPPAITETDFNKSITLSVGETKTFSDGLKLKLAAINDSRCKAGVVCVWAGELSAQFEMTGGATGQQIKNFNLGTTNAKSIIIDGYTFTLAGATERTATFIVVKSATVATCFVGGCSSHICSDQPNAVSTCEYREEYACYKTATCERQQNGQCGWTQNVELTSCLQGK